MGFSVGATICVLLSALALLSTAHGRMLSHSDRAKCGSKPPNGTWVMDHSTPMLPNPDTIRHARSVLYMNEVEENFYIGDGSGVYFLSHIHDGYNGTLWTYHVALSFDHESCMLSGTIFIPVGDTMYPDAAEYFYDGEMITGIFVFPLPRGLSGTGEKELQTVRLSPYPGHHEGTHIGDP